MDTSTSYFSSTVAFYVPPGRPYTSLEKLLFPFDTNVWRLICLFLFIFLVLRILLRFIDVKVLPALDVVRLILGLDSINYRGPSIFKLLIIVLALNFLIIRSSYQGSLFKFLSNQKNVTPPTTIQELYDQGYTFYIPDVAMPFLGEFDMFKSRYV